MNFRDANQDSTEVKYISKRVMVNGQFVTLYSANGQTWISSPEDLPALMERLDNARVTLNTAEKVAEGESAKVAEPESKSKKEAQETPERALSSKYRMKGPKPRPILRQDGVVIKGTPIEPISASATVLSFSSDVKPEEQRKTTGKNAKITKAKDTKLIAPIVSKKVVKPAAKSAALPVKAAGKAAGKSAPAPIAAKDQALKATKPISKTSQSKKQTTSSKSIPAKAVKKVAVAKGTKKAKAAPSKGSKASKKAQSKTKRSKK